MKTYYKECFLEQIYHFHALGVWDKLKTGACLTLLWDKTDVIYSKNIKVKTMFDTYKTIGILSEEDSESMIPFLKSGWDHLFSAEICSKDDKQAEDKRIKIIVYIEENLN